MLLRETNTDLMIPDKLDIPENSAVCMPSNENLAEKCRSSNYKLMQIRAVTTSLCKSEQKLQVYANQSRNYNGMQIDMLQYTIANTLHNECKVTGHRLRVINSARSFSKINCLTHNM